MAYSRTKKEELQIGSQPVMNLKEINDCCRTGIAAVGLDKIGTLEGMGKLPIPNPIFCRLLVWKPHEHQCSHRG